MYGALSLPSTQWFAQGRVVNVSLLGVVISNSSSPAGLGGAGMVTAVGIVVGGGVCEGLARCRSPVTAPREGFAMAS